MAWERGYEVCVRGCTWAKSHKSVPCHWAKSWRTATRSVIPSAGISTNRRMVSFVLSGQMMVVKLMDFNSGIQNIFANSSPAW